MKGKSTDKKAEKRPALRSAGFFAMRTPLLPVEEMLRWSEGLTGAAALGGDPAALDAALASDAAVLRERLRALVARPEVREALFVASPSMWESLPHWIEAPDGERGQKVERSLVKYFARMAVRSTPFGLFAGSSVGRIGDRNDLVVTETKRLRRHTRLDGDYLDSLCRAMLAAPPVRAALVLRPNSSLYRVAGRLRYAESRLLGKVRTYHLVAVDPDTYLEAVLERAAQGATVEQLAEHLSELDPDVTVEEAAGYVRELVDAQILVSDLEPAVTGAEPLDDVLSTLGTIPVAAPIAAALTRTRGEITALDQAGVGNDPARYHAIAQALAELPAQVELPRLFQVDLYRPAPEATLSRAMVDELVRAVELAARIAPPPGDDLASFRSAFSQRYEMAEVPLAQALDEESGIGFEKSDAPAAEAAPLLEGVPFFPRDDESRAPAGRAQRILADLVAAGLARGEIEVDLAAGDTIEKLAPAARPPRSLPQTFSVMFKLGAASREAFERGEFEIHFNSASGPSGALLLGRFCHGDAELSAEVSRHLRDEEAQQPDAIFAEIVHLPEGRIGNVIFRPQLRDYEIPYLGRSGAPRDHQLPLDDLLVSVRGDRVVLRSRRLGKEVIPRNTTAHNFRGRSLGPYRFLCAMQRQSGVGAPVLGALDLLPFLPRIRAGRVVFAPARWRLAPGDLEPFKAPTRTARFLAAGAMRQRLRLPRHALLVDSDNKLPIDFDNVLSVEAFAQLVKDRDSVTLVEQAPSYDQLVVHGPEGRYLHELVIPFVKEAEPASEKRAAERPAADPSRPPPRRRFAPGSEWLYAKLYTGTGTADHVLRDVVAPLVSELRESGAVDRWFYIRYADPDQHLRVRFHGDPQRLAAEALPAVHAAAAPLLDDGRIAKIAFDTYDREIERYGGAEGIELAETLFHADSQAVLDIVCLLGGDEGQRAAWQMALVGIDVLWTDLGLDLDARLSLAARSRDSLKHEHNARDSAEVVLDRALGEKFRKERAGLEALFDPSRHADSDLAPGHEILAERSQRLAPVAAALREMERSGRLGRGINDALAWDFSHMYANRLLRAAARAQELVLYDFLARIYESRKARARAQAKGR